MGDQFEHCSLVNIAVFNYASRTSQVKTINLFNIKVQRRPGALAESKFCFFPYLKLEKSSGSRSKYLMSLMLTFPTIFFVGPPTTGRPPIWFSLIRLKASRINSLPWMLTT